ncbi:MAG: Trm112 family protein [Candidatus Diapherotrites archaeon]|nr:Trm112 family protein [Candidatus Diapherotrites archaeon]
MDKRLLEVLACPKCKGSLDYDKKNSRLLCKKCKLAYRIEGGIPIMLVEEAEKTN